jgi:hypothetical protein
MEAAKIAYVLDKFGYSMDTWSGFNDIPLLTMLQDTNVLIHPEYMRLRFNSTEELVEIVYGTETEGGFTAHDGRTSNYEPDSFVPFSEICAIINTSYRSPYGTYYTKFFGSISKF